jgi:spermidine synthase
VAIVGLGTGTLATYARLDDHYRFYEINPAVTDAARKWFTYLADCRGTVEVVEGDARLVLERENETPYDVIVLDAFSGDSVPVHLLTREAFAIYQRRLRPDGLILVNVLNHHLQLASEVERQADAIGLRHARIIRASNSSKLQFNTDWMILTSDADFIKALPSDVPQDLVEQEALHRHIPLWTDHYTNLVDLLTDR